MTKNKLRKIIKTSSKKYKEDSENSDPKKPERTIINILSSSFEDNSPIIDSIDQIREAPVGVEFSFRVTASDDHGVKEIKVRFNDEESETKSCREKNNNYPLTCEKIFTRTENSIGEHSYRVFAFDEAEKWGASLMTINIVDDYDHSPIINSINLNGRAIEGEPFSFTVSVVDDHEVRSIRARFSDGSSSTHECGSAECTAEFSRTEMEAGRYSYTILAFDNTGDFGSDLFEVDVEEKPCVDNDNGRDYFTASNVIMDNQQFNDACQGNVIIENYCANNQRETEMVNCEFGCSDGRCNDDPREHLRYDRNGNLIEGHGFRYEYDDFNQLKRILNGDDTVSEFFYDPDGNRIKKIDHNENGITTTYYIGGNLVRVVGPDGEARDTIYYYYDDQLVGSKDPNGVKKYYHSDHLGSTSIVTDQQGNLVEETKYLPFGGVLEGGNDRFLYTGKEKDSSGLYYYGARYYNPDFMRFIQPDSIIPDAYDPQSLNKYSYVLNNPYKYTDPSGNVAFIPLLIGIGVAIVSFLAATSSYWMPHVMAYSTYGNVQTIENAVENPTAGNVAWAGLVGYDIVTPGIPEGKIARGVVKGAEKISKEAKILQTGGQGTTAVVNSFKKAGQLLHEAFPGYKKVRGNTAAKRSLAKKEALKEAFKEGGTYKMDYQYIQPDKIHITGTHASLPHININRLDKTKVTIMIDKTKR